MISSPERIKKPNGFLLPSRAEYAEYLQRGYRREQKKPFLAAWRSDGVLSCGQAAIHLGLRLAIVCARKPRALPVGVQGQRSHDQVGHDYRQGIQPDAVANPQERS